MRPFLARAVLVAALAGLIAMAIGQRSLAALRPEYGGTLRLAAFGTLIVDPVALPLPTEPILSEMVFETLFSVDSAGALVPGLAREWKLSDDKLTLNLTLAPANFSNGDPVTPERVIASLSRLKGTSQEWLISNLILDPSGIRALPPAAAAAAMDPNAVAETVPERMQLRMRTPDAMTLFKLAHPASAITLAEKDGVPVGTGPFAVGSATRDGKSLSLTPNPHHREGPPFLESVEVTLLDAVDAALRDLERGQLDLAPVPIDQVDRLAGGVPELRLHTLRNLQTVALLLHPARFGVAQKDWILSRLDLASMVSFRLRGHGVRSRCFEAKLTPYAVAPPDAVPMSGSAPSSARPWRLLLPGHLPLAQQLAARIRGELQGHGVAIEVEPLEPSALSKRVTAGDFDLALVFVRTLGAPPLTLLDWAQALEQPLPAMDSQLASWLLADESFQRLPTVCPLFGTDVHYAAQSRLVDLEWSPGGRPTLEQTWWKPRLDNPER